MLRSQKAVALTLATLCAAGCADSDRRVSPRTANYKHLTPGRETWHPTSDLAMDNAAEAGLPVILPETHFAAARLFESRGLLGKAIHQYRKAIAVNHNYTEAYHRLGLLSSVVGRREEAVEAYRRAVELEPKNAILRNNLGFELMLSNRWREAEEELSRAIRLKPNFPRAYVNLGIVQGKVGRFKEALASFRTVVPEADAYYNLGLIYRGQQRYADAVGAFRHVLAVDPDFIAAQTQLEQIVSQYKPETPVDAGSRVAKSAHGVYEIETVARPRPYEMGIASPERTTGADEPIAESLPAAVSRADRIGWEHTLALLDEMMARAAECTLSRSASETIEENEPISVEAMIPDRPEAIVTAASDTTPAETSIGDRRRAENLSSIIAILENELGRVEQEFVEQTGSESTAGPDITAARRDWIDRPAARTGMAAVANENTADAIHASETDESVSYAEAEPSVSFAEVGRQASYVDVVPPVSPADAVTPNVSPAEPTIAAAPTVEAVSCIDSWALLGELEEQLSIVRNEIKCLESAYVSRKDTTTSAQTIETHDDVFAPPRLYVAATQPLMGPPAPDASAEAIQTMPRVRQSRGSTARLVVDVINQWQALGVDATIRATPIIDIATQRRAKLPETAVETVDDKPRETTPPAQRAPAGPPTLEESIEDIIAQALNEIACWQAELEARSAEPAAVRRRPPHRHIAMFDIDADLFPEPACGPVDPTMGSALTPDDEHTRQPRSTGDGHLGLRGAFGHPATPPR